MTMELARETTGKQTTLDIYTATAIHNGGSRGMEEGSSVLRLVLNAGMGLLLF